MWIAKSSNDQILTPTAIALGNFDGIHIGHKQVISSIWTHKSVSGSFSSSLREKPRQVPDKSRTPGYPMLYSTVVTFNPHPREYFSGQKKQCLTPLPEKIKLLEKMGIEQLVLLPFDRELASLNPQQFVEKILVQKLRARRVSIGEDFRFGKERSGGADDLKTIADKFGIEVIITSLQTCYSQGERVSSSRIRAALANGEIIEANKMLGRPYTLTGTVVTGQKLGRTIGFPTANLQLAPEKLLPRYGVYCVRVTLENNETEKIPTGYINGVMNIGYRPTVEGDQPTVEVHLLDWSGNLYDQCLSVSLEEFLRPEVKFPSLEALSSQIQADCDLARQILQKREEGIGNSKNVNS